MKTIKFFTYALFTMSLLIASCSAEDGEDGLDGLNGVDGSIGLTGADGSDGTDGTNGEDGNANVSTFIFDTSDFSGDFLQITVDALTQDVIDNDVVLTYVTSQNEFNNVVTSFQLPGALRDNDDDELFFVRVEQFPRERNTDNLVFTINRISDGAAHNVPVGQFLETKVIIIESNSTTRSSQLTKETVLAELEAAGVDTNNYDDVIAYYGL